MWSCYFGLVQAEHRLFSKFTTEETVKNLDKEYTLGGSISGVYGFEQNSEIPLPLFSCGVSAGFPSPADDYIGQKLDINNLLIRNPASTFFVRVAGDSMIEAGINNNDILVVDRSLELVSGKIIIAAVNGEITVKRLIKTDCSCELVAANSNYPPIIVTEELSCVVWGVVTSAIHQF